MDKETLEKLIADQPKDIRGRAVLLYNGAANGAVAYQKAATAANLRDWEAAQTALEKFVAQIGAGVDGPPPDQPLANLSEVLAYLQESDWRVTKTSLYRHQKEGKLAPRADGAYALKDVEKYARTWLKQQSTGKRLQEKTESLQRQKLEVELKNLGWEEKRKELAYGKEVGLLIPKALMEVELAGRAGILDAGLKHWIQSSGADLVREFEGNMKRVGEFISTVKRELDELLNNYAAPLDYQVIVDMDEETDAAQEHEQIEGEGE